MSGMMFAISTEPLLHNFRSSVNGLFLPDVDENVLNADDVVVIVKTQDDVNVVGDIVQTFGKISSAKVNWNKSWRWSAGLPELPGGLRWKRGGFKYLGVFLGGEQTLSKNWKGVEKKTEGRLKKWKWLSSHM